MQNLPLKPNIKLENNYKWKALITVAMGTIMATMDASITNISFPKNVPCLRPGKQIDKKEWDTFMDNIYEWFYTIEDSYLLSQ